ncbi:MAG: AAA family ATPase, partial [Natronomonas sp.]
MNLTAKPALRSGSTDGGTVVLAAATMGDLGVEEGDPVAVTAAETTVAGRVETGSEATTGTEIARLVQPLRRALGVEVGETVSIRSVDPEPADRIVLSLPESVAESRVLDLGTALSGRCLVAGQTLAVGDSGVADGHTADASHSVPVHVVEASPDGVVTVRDWTSLRLRGEDGTKPRPLSESNTVGYDDVGGLESVVDRVRELLEVPLTNPELFRSLDVDPPQGILLCGPPGTGKTLLVEALGAEGEIPLITVQGSDAISGDPRDNPFEAAVEAALEEAPSILFVDDLDSLSAGRDGERSHRRVARLVSALEEIDPDSRVAVVGATTDPEALPASLALANRFDRRIEVPIPDQDGRREILDVHTAGVPLADDVDLAGLAERTHGFVGRDIERLIREAAIRALRRNGLGPEDGDGPTDPATLEDIAVTGADVEDALRAVDPSALREVFVEVPDATWDDVGGLEDTT